MFTTFIMLGMLWTHAQMCMLKYLHFVWNCCAAASERGPVTFVSYI